MCLYGHDLDDTTTPVEAALSWIIGKDRRANGGFHGDSVILNQLKKKSEGGGVSRRRIGLVVEGSPAREGADIVDEAGEKIGNVTSGCPSPTLKKNIAMGYIKDGMHKAGTEVSVVVRGKKRRPLSLRCLLYPASTLSSPLPRRHNAAQTKIRILPFWPIVFIGDGKLLYCFIHDSRATKTAVSSLGTKC
jgi:aminomethyltransferase